MAQPLAIAGTFSDLKTVKTRSVVQLIIEVPIERGGEVVAMFGFPQPGAEISVAVAMMMPAAETIEHAPAKISARWSSMPRAQQAGIRCNEPAFWRFLTERHDINVMHADEAAQAVRDICQVTTRAALDGPAASAWDRLDAEFDLWMKHPELAA